MNYRHLQLLRLVVAHGTFAEAAARTGISPSAVSQAMKTLEHEWKVALFDRHGRRIVPTAAARRAAALFEEGDQRLRLALSPAAQEASRPTSMLRVALATAPAMLYGPVIEEAWRQHAPHGVLQIRSPSSQDTLAALHRHELDMAISPLPRRQRTDGLGTLRLHRNSSSIVARRGHPLSQARSLTELTKASWALAQRVGDLGLIEEAYQVRGMPPPSVVAECPDFGALLHLVAHSDLLCLLPHPVLLNLADPEALASLQVQEGLPHYEVFLLWPAAEEAGPCEGVLAVTDALRRHVAAAGRSCDSGSDAEGP